MKGEYKYDILIINAFGCAIKALIFQTTCTLDLFTDKTYVIVKHWTQGKPFCKVTPTYYT